jgi:hypothetical protein
MNNGTVESSTQLLANPAWTVAGVGDYTGDGRSDISWTNAGTGQTVEWMMNGTSVTSSVGLLTSTAWTPAAGLLHSV